MTAWTETVRGQRWRRSDGAAVFVSNIGWYVYGVRHSYFVAAKPTSLGGGMVTMPKFGAARLFSTPADARALLDREFPADA